MARENPDEAATVDQEAGAPEILWDTWGVPHINASTAEGLFYAFGWAQMHSHADLILTLYGEARGRAAEYWGKDHLDSDKFLHTMAVPARAQAWYEAQSSAERARLDAFVAGMNAYVRVHRERIADRVATVLPVQATDVLAHLQRAVHLTFLAGGAVPQAQTWQEAMGSNGWAIGPSHSATGNALLLANPHLAWSGLFTWFEAQLSGPEVNIYGAALVGMPILAIAFNDHLGWTHTVNPIAGISLYELSLTEDGYQWDQEEHDFTTDILHLKIKQEDGSLQGEELVVRCSVHGPVVARKGDKALALCVTGLDQPHLFDQYWDMARATTLAEFETALQRLQMPMFNVIYADQEGHILYLFGGRVPVRDHGDWAYWQRTVPGHSSATLWNETHPYDALPQVVDPPTGWVQNANDPPWYSTFPPVLDPEAFPFYMAPRGLDLRPQRALRMLLEDKKISFEKLVQYKHSTRVELADRILDELIPAARQYGGKLAKEAARVLKKWDRQTEAGSQGAVLFLAWFQEVGQAAFAHPWDADDPLGTPRDLEDPVTAAAALESTAATVKAAYGRLDVPWGEIYRIRYAGKDLPANGGWDPLGIIRNAWFGAADQEGRYALTGGDSYIAVVEFSNPVHAEVLLAYGNATQLDSPHRGDQLELFVQKALRPVWRTRELVEAHLECREVLQWWYLTERES